ncbi:integral membrane sensor signal transduction histidine kinase [Alkaliphilus metalliredigens QYMF]|uniref:histidine kinase n=1 Tax=Alkaliphilus metalliredigens (strain QYMF) TaxID=293826 RepID=A6TUG3_ALKMQ|nr:integral membrane sensor signal transduction histidine kinase [Alkaliphilus metalliredigens QYMF]
MNNQNDYNEDSHDKKDKRSFLASSLVTVLLIFIFAVASVVSYLPIRNSFYPVEENTKAYLESNDFVYNLSRLTRNLQQSVNETNDGYDDGYDDRYVSVESVKYRVNHLESEGLASIDGVDSTENIMEEDTVERTFLSNMSDTTESALQKEIKDSLFYMRAKFDENGNPEIETSLGSKFNKDIFINRLTYSNEESIEQYTNLEMLYIVPQDFEKHNDVFTFSMKNQIIFPNYAMLIVAIGAVGILILIIGGFAVPYSAQSKMAISKMFNKMFLELKFIVWGAFVLLCAGIGSMINSYNHYGYDIGNFIYDVDPYFYLVGIILTSILYLLIYLSTVYLKYIYHTGFKKGLIDNSFFGKILLYCIRRVRSAIKGLIQIDLRQDNYRRLVGLVGVNLLAIVILGSGRFWGFILAIVYSLFIFKYLLRVFDKAKDLNDASAQVAEGNFEISLDEDMGVLSPMAKNLNNINKGFQLAVDKEIKSQRMKSELISNVSHDLKTPLTSIITYVDLLKGEEIDPEIQKGYIDILDKKSQRLKVLIEDLFEASKATSGNVELHLEKIDVIALFRQTLGELEEKINDSTLQMKINTPEDKVICELDGKRTYRIFENIMGNIFKYALQNSRVYIDIIENEKEVSFIFKNISAYEMNFDATEITERFTRGDQARSTEGSGLGLSIAKSFIELQRGTLKIIIDGDLFKLIVIFPKAVES